MIDLYVNPNGNDTTGNGNKANPYQSIKKAVSMVSDNTNIYLSEGIHLMYSLLDMSSASGVITYYGEGLSTIIELQYCYTNGSFKNKMVINDCIIRPSDSFARDTSDARALSYTSDSYEVRFNYVLFNKSLNGSYPTSTVFYFHNNTYDFNCNKFFTGCSFIHTAGYPIWLGACTLINCTTTYSALSHPSITIEKEINCLYSQTYNNIYELVNSDNSIYGVYPEWAKIRAMIQFNNKYYTISNNQLIEADLKIENSFYIQYIKNFDMDVLKRYSPFRFVLFSKNKNKHTNIRLPLNHNYAFILINLSNINHNDIRLDSPHKILVSDDLKTWNNYYNADNYNSIYLENYDARYLKYYIDEKGKYIDYVNKNYNYILLKLNKGENFFRLLETVHADYKKIDLDTNFKTGITNQVQITASYDSDELIVRKTKSIPENIIIEDSLYNL